MSEINHEIKLTGYCDGCPFANFDVNILRGVNETTCVFLHCIHEEACKRIERLENRR